MRLNQIMGLSSVTGGGCAIIMVHIFIHQFLFFTHTCLTSSSFNKDDKIVHAIKSIVHEIVMVLPARL